MRRFLRKTTEKGRIYTGLPFQRFQPLHGCSAVLLWAGDDRGPRWRGLREVYSEADTATKQRMRKKAWERYSTQEQTHDSLQSPYACRSFSFLLPMLWKDGPWVDYFTSLIPRLLGVTWTGMLHLDASYLNHNRRIQCGAVFHVCFHLHSSHISRQFKVNF